MVLRPCVTVAAADFFIPQNSATLPVDIHRIDAVGTADADAYGLIIIYHIILINSCIYGEKIREGSVNKIIHFYTVIFLDKPY